MAFRIIYVCFIVIFLLSSCDDDEDSSLSIGKNFINPQSAIVMVDSFTVKMSTVLLDSVPTSGNETLLTGKYTDEYLGKVSASGFFQLTLNDSAIVSQESVFDSLTLMLHFNSKSYGDTLQYQVLNVHRVSQDIEEHEDGYLYNTSFFQYEKEPIGSKTILAKPHLHDELEIRLSDKLGLEFFDKMKSKSEEFATTTDFREYFKGLVVAPGNENSSVLTFEATDSLLEMRLYSHYVEEHKVEEIYKFPMFAGTTNFNRIETDRSGTDIENLSPEADKISSAMSGQKAFLQAGTGLVPRFDFPGVGSLLEFNKGYVFYKAEIEFHPEMISNSQVDFPDQITCYSTNKYNGLETQITTTDGSVSYADFYYDEMYNENSYYSFDITDFITDELSDAYYDPDCGLIVFMPDEIYQGSLERLIINGSKNLAYRPRLKMYFLFYQ